MTLSGCGQLTTKRGSILRNFILDVLIREGQGADVPSEIKLFNEDCLPAMRKMPDKCFDLAIVDKNAQSIYTMSIRKDGVYGN